MEAQESTLSTTATEGPGEAAAGQQEQRDHRTGVQSHAPSLTGKMVMKTYLCQKVLEGHTNAIDFD